MNYELNKTTTYLLSFLPLIVFVRIFYHSKEKLINTISLVYNLLLTILHKHLPKSYREIAQLLFTHKDIWLTVLLLHLGVCVWGVCMHIHKYVFETSCRWPEHPILLSPLSVLGLQTIIPTLWLSELKLVCLACYTNRTISPALFWFIYASIILSSNPKNSTTFGYYSLSTHRTLLRVLMKTRYPGNTIKLKLSLKKYFNDLWKVSHLYNFKVFHSAPKSRDAMDSSIY